ncbi:MAG TPA: hypothetical protein VFA48_09240 [Gammaproteobacteria bacterium]|nr:hypothetical protein [Gammaproteobacteria bacterium]
MTGRKRIWTLGALAATMAWAAPALANNNSTMTVTIKQTAKPFVYQYPGVSLDILGLKLGMSVQQAEKVLAAYSKNKPMIFKKSLLLSYKTVRVSSQNFIWKIAVDNGQSGGITLFFGSPATGNKLLHIDLTMGFPDATKGPTLKATDAALYKKYGPATKTPVSPTDTYIQWVFGQHNLKKSCPYVDDIPCDAVNFGNDPGQYAFFGYDNDPTADPALYRNSYAYGNYVDVEAAVHPAGEDASRVGSIYLSLNDQAQQAITSDLSQKQLQTAARAAYAKQTPGAAPKF